MRPLGISFTTNDLPIIKSVTEILHENSNISGRPNLPEESLTALSGLFLFGSSTNAVQVNPVVDLKADMNPKLLISGHKTAILKPGEFTIYVVCLKFLKFSLLNLCIGEHQVDKLPLPPTCGQTIRKFNTDTPELEIYGDIIECNDEENTNVYSALYPYNHRLCSVHGPLNFMSNVTAATLTGHVLRVYFSALSDTSVPDMILVKFKQSTRLAFTKNPCKGHIPAQNDIILPLVHSGPRLRLLPMETIMIPLNTSFISSIPNLQGIIFDGNHLPDIRISPTSWCMKSPCQVFATNLTSAVKFIPGQAPIANVAFFIPNATPKKQTVFKKLTKSHQVELPGGICIDLENQAEVFN